MEDMNPVLGSIYGTGGHEKVASAGGHEVDSLSDLALLIVTDGNPEGADLEKVASPQREVYDDLISFDRAGRAMAQHEFTEMEKEAAGGNPEALNAFFADMLPEEALEQDSERAALRSAVVAELQSRLN